MFAERGSEMSAILIVDDERTIREELKMTLSGEGFAVRTARDGEDALGKIREHKPDLVLLDVMMPRMNGFIACEDAMLYMHISNLRKKLGSASSMIVNKRRVGYGIEE